jgi:hypothetical protein
MSRVIASSAHPKGRRIFGMPIVVALFFLAMMMPTPLSVSAGSLRLSAFRVLLLVMFVPMILSLLSGRRGKVNIFDILIIAHGLWALLALIKWGGVAQGIESGGIYIVECVGAYLVGRLYIRSYEDFEAFAKGFVAVVVGMLLFTIPEAATEQHILRDGASSLFGGPRAHYMEKRMGLERAFGSFDHPILYGVYSASAFSMAYFLSARAKLMNFRGSSQAFGVLIATFLSGSGGPYLVLMMQMFVIGWERALKGVVHRWTALFTLIGAMYVWIDVMSTRTPFHVFVTYFTFSTQSAYNRIHIWNYGTAEVGRYPMFGIGLGQWTRPVWMSESMDNFWLLTAVRYGLPAMLFLMAAMIGLVIAAAQRKGLPDPWRRARHAWAFTLFGIAVAAATVHLWNALFVLFLFLIGSGAWLIDSPLPSRHRGSAAPTNPAARRALRPSLF